MATVLKFFKPFGVLTKFTDADGRPNLGDYIDVPEVYSAGRLDKDSEGLLILTDDGRLQQRLTEPRFAHPRTYLAQVEGIPHEAALAALRKGVVLKDGRTRPAHVELLDTEPTLPERSTPIRYRASIPDSWIRITITEGRNRQVRRMTAAVGFPTLRLVRWAIGKVTAADLAPGEYRALSDEELDALPR